MMRLVYLAGLRDQNTGAYRDRDRIGAENCRKERVLRGMHERVFCQWLSYRPEERRADLELYLSDIGHDRTLVLKVWRDLEPYRMLVPPSAGRAERELFASGMQRLLALMAVHARVEEAAEGGPEGQESGQAARLRVSASPACQVCCGETGKAPTVRENDVLRLIARGKTNKEMASALQIGESTVAEYRKHLCKKFGLHSTGELVACAVGRVSGICRQELERFR